MIDNVKIMVIVQDPAIRNFIVDVLEFSVNRKILPFESGSRALEHIESDGRVDIVICARDIPGISGIALMTAFKAKWPDVVCILISDPPYDPQASSGAVIDSHLETPFEAKDLFDIVQKFVVDGE
jgi:DNA-binding NtrC family response regulator